jgi:hypothetical protein
MRLTVLSGIFLACAYTAVSGCAHVAAAELHSLEVRWENSLVSVSATSVPLKEVLSEVGRVTRVQFSGIEELEGKVTIRRERVSLESLLRELIGDRPHAITRLSQPATGTPGIEIAFPMRVERRSSAPKRNPMPTSANTVTEERWFDAEGKPRFDVLDRTPVGAAAPGAKQVCGQGD